MPPELKCAVRYDSVPLGQTYFTEEGYLVDRPVLTSTGIFEYSNDDGTIRRELRLPEEVFAPESLKTYKGKPIIITHDAGLITKDNVHAESVGTILSEGYRSGKDVRAEIIIHDTDEMREAGLKELSLGYNLELEETPGVWRGEPYDAIQRNITINHLALVLEARAGEQARLNIDSRNGKSKGAANMSTARKKNRRTGAGTVQKKARRADSVLSPEELEEAIRDYKARQAKRGNPPRKEDAEDEPALPEKRKGAVPPAADEDDTGALPAAAESRSDDPEEQVQFVKDRRDRRDEEGDPGSRKEAMGIIAQQDDDIDTLFNIIDTLLAERDFARDAESEAEEVLPAEAAADAEDDEEAVLMDGEEEEEALLDDGEEAFAEDDEEAEFCGDDGEEEEFAEDDEEEEFAEDDEEELNADDDDDEIPNTQDTDVTATGLREPQIKTDSIDRIVRQRVQIQMAAQALHMDGLENMKLMPAKKAVIRAVRPGLRLDGRSRAYIDAAFDCAVNDVMARQRKTTKYQKKQMFNRDSGTVKRGSAGGSSQEARARMIRRQTGQKKGVK